MQIDILGTGLKFPEGPVVTPNGSMYCVELLGGSITQYHRDTKQTTRIHVGGAPNGLLALDDQTLVFCDSKNHSIRSLNVLTQETKTLADQIHGEPLRAPNDLIVDDFGNILFTCPGGSVHQPIGYMCVLTKEQELKVIAKDMYFPNGLLLIHGGKQIIINETWQHRLLIGDWHKDTLEIENIRPFFTIGGIAEPDGLALHNNLIYAAVYNTGMLWVFDMNGNLVNQIGLPGKCPTNVCVDTKYANRLIVTEAEKGLLLSVQLSD